MVIRCHNRLWHYITGLFIIARKPFPEKTKVKNEETLTPHKLGAQVRTWSVHKINNELLILDTDVYIRLAPVTTAVGRKAAQLTL